MLKGITISYNKVHNLVVSNRFHNFALENKIGQIDE